MNAKTMIAAVVGASLALLVLPGLAVGDVVHYESTEFTVSNEGSLLLESSSGTISCASIGGEGEFDEESPSKTGHGYLIFHGCKAFGTNCQTAGQPTGTVKTTELSAHLVRLTSAEEDTPGVLVAPNTKETEGTPHFATFKCAGGLVTITIRGNGVIGQVLEGYNKALSTYTLSLKTNEEGTDQEFVHYFDVSTEGEEEVHTTDGPYRTEISLNGGAFNPAYLVGKGQIHPEGEAEITTTHTE